MRWFISSDIHSFYDEWMSALEKNNFDKSKDGIILLGDLLDRGDQSVECLDFVNSLSDEQKILILGNHEELMVEMLIHGCPRSHDIHNCTDKTVKQVTGLDNIYDAIIEMKSNEKWNQYYNSCIDFAELGDNIFVHGWIPTKTIAKPIEGVSEYYWPTEEVYDPDWRNASVIAWENARWINGMKYWHRGIREKGKTIWCGHWHTSYGHSVLHGNGQEFEYFEGDHAIFDPFEDEGIIAMDGCCAISHQVNCKILEVK